MNMLIHVDKNLHIDYVLKFQPVYTCSSSSFQNFIIFVVFNWAVSPSIFTRHFFLPATVSSVVKVRWKSVAHYPSYNYICKRWLLTLPDILTLIMFVPSTCMCLRCWHACVCVVDMHAFALLTCRVLNTQTHAQRNSYCLVARRLRVPVSGLDLHRGRANSWLLFTNIYHHYSYYWFIFEASQLFFSVFRFSSLLSFFRVRL